MLICEKVNRIYRYVYTHSEYMYFFPNQHDSCPYDWRGDGQTDLVPGDYGYVRPSLLGSTVMRIGLKKKQYNFDLD